MGAGFVPVRKEGKLPYETFEATYALEYGEDTLTIHQDDFPKGPACFYAMIYWRRVARLRQRLNLFKKQVGILSVLRS